MDKSKKFVFNFIIFSILVIPINYTFNYIIDPFGIRNSNNKFVEQLNAQWTYLYKPRILQKAPYYLLGTSRSEQIDSNLVSHYLNKHLIYLGMSNQSLNEALFLIKKIKNNKNNFITGFDVIQTHKYHSTGGNRLEEGFFYNNLISNINLYLNSKTTQESLIYITNKLLRQKRDFEFIKKDNELYSYTIDNINKKVRDDNQYKNYQANIDETLQLAKLADSNDIIIIFPKLATFYKKFQEYHNIEKQYFDLIRLLVNNTKAQVWSFYGINEITTNKNNFDDIGWHFKPKIGKLIFARIFNDTSINIPKKFGILIDRNNVEEYLTNTHNDIKKYQPPLTY